MERANFRLLLIVVCGTCGILGCSKSSSEKSPAAEKAEPAVTSTTTTKTTNVHATINRPPSPSLTRAPKEASPMPKPSALEKDYRATTDENRKTEIIYKLGEVGSPDSVVTLGRLFRTEEDAD